MVALAVATLDGEVQAAAASRWIHSTRAEGHETWSAKMKKRKII
jgi:hypothetical protein